MRWRALWMFLPDEALPLVLIGGALLVIGGLIRPRQLFAIVVGLALLPFLAPVIDGLFEALPWWMTVLIICAVALSSARAIAALFLGDRAAAHMVGALATDVVRGAIKLTFGLPFTIIRALRGLH